MPPATRLAELVAARLCHDLGSPIATLAALQGQTGQDAGEILRETTEELSLRLRLCAQLFGQGEDPEWEGLGKLLRGAPMAHRVRFVFGPPPPGGGAGGLGPELSRLVLVAALQAAEALPRGGEVRVSAAGAGAAAALEIRPEGRDAAWPAALLRLLEGGPLEDALAEGPRRVLAPWLVALAEGAGARLALGEAPATGPAPLRIALPAPDPTRAL